MYFIIVWMTFVFTLPTYFWRKMSFDRFYDILHVFYHILDDICLHPSTALLEKDAFCSVLSHFAYILSYFGWHLPSPFYRTSGERWILFGFIIFCLYFIIFCMTFAFTLLPYFWWTVNFVRFYQILHVFYHIFDIFCLHPSTVLLGIYAFCSFLSHLSCI